MKTKLTKMKVTLLSTVMLLTVMLTKSNAETIYTDDFSFQTNWTQSASGGSVSIANNAINLIGGAVSSSNAGRKSILPAATFVSDSVAVQFEFFSSSIGFQVQLGTTPNRIQILKEGSLGTQLRFTGEATSLTTNGAKVVTTTASAWHTMLVKYKKTATTTTATFILDNGALTQVVDLSLQPAGYDFKLDAINLIALGSTTVENVYIRNVSVIGTKLSYPLLYSDNFTHKSNWSNGNALKGTMQFVQDPDNTANNILQIADTTALSTDFYITTSKLPVFNFTGADYLISYKYKTKINKGFATFGGTLKRLQLNAETSVSRPYLLRFSGEGTQSANGSQFLDKATFEEWHTVDIKYTAAAKTAQLTVDGDKASVVAVTVDLNLQATPYDFILDLVAFKAGAGNVMQIKDLKVYGVGSASYSTPSVSTAGINDLFIAKAGIKNLNFIDGVITFNLNNSVNAPAKVTLYNLVGAKVFERNNIVGSPVYSVQSNDLNAGVYIVSVESAGKQYTGKLMVK